MNLKLRIIAGTMALATILSAGTASAGHHGPTIDLSGHGTISVDEGWRYVLKGTAQGQPFRGDWVGTIKPSIGVWPDPGTCVDGDATLVVDGPRRKEITAVAIGEVCAPYADGITAVKYSFVGQFDAYEAIPRRIADTQGWMEMIVATDGSTHLTAVSF